MKRFRFTLETLLEVRRREEDAVKLELGEVNRTIAEARRGLQGLHEQLVELQASELAARSGARDVVALRYSVAYRHKLKTDMLRAGRTVQQLQADADAVRARLISATQRRRAIELIRERRYGEWRREYTVKEQNGIDEVSQQKFIRDGRAAARRSAPA